MKSYKFTLVLSGVAEPTPDLADALYTATQGDIELNLRDGAKPGVRVVRVESEAANVIAKINADLLGVTSG